MEADVLLVIDMLKDFIDEDGKLFCGPSSRAIIPNVKARVDAYRKDNKPIIWLCDSHDKDDKEFERFPEHAVVWTDGANIISELDPNPEVYGEEYVITKTRYSGFYGTLLEPLLLGVLKDTLVPKVVEVCGVCSSICVSDTVGDLASRDYSVKIYKNCIADFDQFAHESAIRRMESLYGATII